MLDFVYTHLLDDCTRLFVCRRQTRQMAGEMRFYLALGLDDKTEALGIAYPRSQRADHIRPCIPKRIEQTDPRAELLQALRRPREMILFFAPGLLEQVSQFLGLRKHPLCVIECLRAHLTDMIDAHQPSAVAALRIVHLTFRDLRRRIGPGGGCHAGYDANQPIHPGNQIIYS